MKLLITGGGGFVGSRLARALLARGSLGGQPIEQPRAGRPGRAARRPVARPRVEARIGPLLDQCAALATKRFDGVFHLASAVSGECEADFDLGLRSNLDSTRALLDALRAARDAAAASRRGWSSRARSRCSAPTRRCRCRALVADDTLPAPQTSYGTQKLICEHLVADYTRKGYIDGRAARLMTVTVRPGRPNGAASSFFSGIIREPLAGVEAICPVSAEVSHPVTSPARTVEGLIAVYEASARRSADASRSTCRRSTCASPRCSTRSRRSPAGGARARALRARRAHRRHRRQLAARRDRGARGPARPAGRHRFRRHHPPVHRRLPRSARRRAGAEGTARSAMNRIDLDGRVAVVTGGAQGIGYAIAERMLASGARVSLWDIDARAARRGEGPLGARGTRRRAGRADRRRRGRRRHRGAHRRARPDRHPRQQRRHHRRQRPTWELAPDVWRRVIEVNLVGPYLTCRAVVPHMVERRLRPDRQHRVGGRQGRQPERVALQRVEGRPDRAHQVARQGARDQGRAGQRGRAGGGEDGDVRRDDADPHRLHAVEDPDGPLPRARRGRGDDRLPRLGGMLVQRPARCSTCRAAARRTSAQWRRAGRPKVGSHFISASARWCSSSRPGSSARSRRTSSPRSAHGPRHRDRPRTAPPRKPRVDTGDARPDEPALDDRDRQLFGRDRARARVRETVASADLGRRRRRRRARRRRAQ